VSVGGGGIGDVPHPTTAAPLASSPPPSLLLASPPLPEPPELDVSQRAVVAHRGGPLLVLAGPGTGKTTTLVEAVAERVRRGCPPDGLLVLTFSRRAAAELRERIVLRLGRTVREPAAFTFHGFCAALVDRYGGGLPRLLSGPERLVRIRELLAGNAAGAGTTRWPQRLRAGLATRGFAEQVADLLDRARERALTAGDLHRLAEREGLEEWAAAADFLDEYSAVLGGRETDYAELVGEALRLLESDLTVLAAVRERYRAVFVDEYQDTDPAQERLLQLIAGDGRDLVAVGDPDQSIYAFRGADLSCLLSFPDRFPAAGGRPAPVCTLAVSRRAGPRLLEVSRRLAGRLPAPGLPVAVLRRHRELAAPPAAPAGGAEVLLFGSDSEQAAGIADLLRRAHLVDGVDWSAMAVLVRSAVRSLPTLRRGLVAAGVPVAVAGEELALAREPAVAVLLAGLQAAADPSRLTAAEATALLVSPLGGATPGQLRRLGRALLAGARAAGEPAPLRSDALIASAVRDPARLAGLDPAVARPARRLADLLASARAALGAGGPATGSTGSTGSASAGDALWALWEGSGWAARLPVASARGGPAGRAADRDLDAVAALFAAVSRTEQRLPRIGVAALLAELTAQEIPSRDRVEGPLARDGVRLLTAHRAKGLEWELVVVAGVQEGGWPDLRRRGSVLGVERLGRSGLPPPAGGGLPALLADERRLFYVACTRARRRLVVTAVSSPGEDGQRPSRFLGELGLPVRPPGPGLPAHLSVTSVVGRLRRLAGDPAADPGAREGAAQLLARLAAHRAADGSPSVPAAHPDHWWGLAPRTAGGPPIRPVEQPVALSPSAVQGLAGCPLRWFLEHEAGATAPATVQQGIGVVVHDLARAVTTGEIPAEPAAVRARLDAAWPALAVEAQWLAEADRSTAAAAVDRFLRWLADHPRTTLGSEVPFADVRLHGAVLRGAADRLDRDEHGRVRVVDYKTSRRRPTGAEVAADLQLAVYQRVVRAGGFAAVTGPDAEPGGAELLQLVAARTAGRAVVQEQPALPPGHTVADQAIADAVALLLAERFPARPNQRCSSCAYRAACPAQDAGRTLVGS